MRSTSDENGKNKTSVLSFLSVFLQEVFVLHFTLDDSFIRRFSVKIEFSLRLDEMKVVDIMSRSYHPSLHSEAVDENR